MRKSDGLYLQRTRHRRKKWTPDLTLALLYLRPFFAKEMIRTLSWVYPADPEYQKEKDINPTPRWGRPGEYIFNGYPCEEKAKQFELIGVEFSVHKA